jgi:hypothetical protein
VEGGSELRQAYTTSAADLTASSMATYLIPSVARIFESLKSVEKLAPQIRSGDLHNFEFSNFVLSTSSIMHHFERKFLKIFSHALPFETVADAFVFGGLAIFKSEYSAKAVTNCA